MYVRKRELVSSGGWWSGMSTLSIPAAMRHQRMKCHYEWTRFTKLLAELAGASICDIARGDVFKVCC